jgi:GTP-binding protein
VGDLLDQLVHFLPAGDDDFVEEDVPKLAIIGRPNVGKSTLLNHLAGEQRVLVSPVPGTTRDPIDVRVVLDGQEYLVIDTAGMRRQPKIKESADFYSVQRAKRVAAESDVALLVVDAVDGVTAQDQRIAEEVRLSGTAMIIVANKWDIADADQRDVTEDGIADRLGFCSWAPLLRMSAKTGARTHRLPKTIAQVLESSQRRLSTGKLNRLITEWTQAHPPPVRKGRRPKILYAVQAGIRPPTFILFVAGGELGDDYLRFIENRLREAIDFSGTPVHVVARKRAARER